MNFDAGIKKITKYLSSENAQPLLVNVQNGYDLNEIITYFDVDDNLIIYVSEFCNKDELPCIEAIFDKVSTENKNCFIIGLTSFLRFLGEDEIKNYLSNIINMTVLNHVVVLTYQCKKQLNFSDPRLERNICLIDGEEQMLPDLIFISKEIDIISTDCVVDGIENVVEKIERNNILKIYIITTKNKNMYNKSIYSISDMSDAYKIIVEKNNIFSIIEERFGNEKQWEYLLNILGSCDDFTEICNNEFGNYQNLEVTISNYLLYSDNKKWLYFISLKIFGTKNNNCLDMSVKNCNTYSNLIREIFRSILSKNHKDNDFIEFYEQRKSLLNALGNPVDEVTDFCIVVLQKEENAIYYLTDNTQQEKELIFSLIEKYFQNFSKYELENILSLVYKDLYLYIKDYRYNLPLLDKYFSLYTHSKVINKIIPQLEKLVNQQALLREYNLILEPRTAKMYEIDKNNSQLYFIDAMGVEYLSFILEKCKEKDLMAEITICCANLPTITCKNKEFISEFESRGILINTIKDLDEIKHHGINDYDYRQRKQPIHIIKELEIIDEMLNNIKTRLIQGCCEKVIVVSDHGASRLAVIHETENMWKMSSKGEHSGRCCPKTDADVKTEFATEEDGFWVLANYDRFKGGRKANVEVHGGATLEEIVVPIIEITKISKDIEVYIVDKVIAVSFRKKAAIKLFSKTKLKNITVLVEGEYYNAKEQDNNIYLIEMPKLKKAKIYTVDVYSSNNLVASGLSFEIKKESSQEKDLL